MDLEEAKTKVGASFMAHVSAAELTVRLVEATTGLRRPEGATAEQALEHMPEVARKQYERMARAAVAYWDECIRSMQRTN